jgi:hypothetical protein
MRGDILKQQMKIILRHFALKERAEMGQCLEGKMRSGQDFYFVRWGRMICLYVRRKNQ